MATKDDGGWAFPTETRTDWYHGMTLRDWFAGQALSGVIVAFGPRPVVDVEDLALTAYKLADAMLEERDVD